MNTVEADNAKEEDQRVYELRAHIRHAKNCVSTRVFLEDMPDHLRTWLTAEDFDNGSRPVKKSA